MRYYLNSFLPARRTEEAKKPYNPILGEVFRCRWTLPGTTPSAQKTSGGPFPGSSTNQVSEFLVLLYLILKILRSPLSASKWTIIHQYRPSTQSIQMRAFHSPAKFTPNPHFWAFQLVRFLKYNLKDKFLTFSSLQHWRGHSNTQGSWRALSREFSQCLL